MEAALRLGVFVAVFAVVAVWEWRLPKRPLTDSKPRRWLDNLGILVVDVVLLRLTVGAAAFATAIYAQEHGWGLFNVLGWPGWLEGLLAFLILDFAIYLQHVMSHALPVFWRLHRVHHADLDIDLTTGVRFHPLEIVISMVWKAAVVAAIGADPWAVVAFEAVLNASSIYTHGNIRVPESADRVLRWLFCTPDMHRVHHSTELAETDSNFGFFLSVWDRLCGTMRQAPRLGQLGAMIGLGEYRRPMHLGRLLQLPFRGAAGRSGLRHDGEA